MPPSPSLRRSPVADPRGDSHKRGRSLESGLSFKEKDDDLALFSEMQSRERDNFLLQTTDDFDDIFSTKLKPFPDFKLGITIPARGESSDLLNADGDKNDYDWLLTPPDTPLFPSLDDEPAHVNLVHSGRSRSRPISISRSSTMEKSYRSARGSASPQRLSPSPRSGSSASASRGRPSSAPHSSPTPGVRHNTPSRRSSPPPAKTLTPSPPSVKPLTPPRRSATPTPRLPSTGSGGTLISPGVRGTSPVRTSRGNSASPKIRAWQSNIPGFSLEAPPNLRTSLADRPASYVRGSSPASRNSRDSSSKIGRQSMSPTASRSISSSHSHERDRLSSRSKGSIASSGDDDADSLQSIPVSGSEQSVPRRVVTGFPNNRPLAYSRKSVKSSSANSAPKRSFDSAMRQMDRRSPQNMFRPLLSSVPSTTFYSGKASSSHRSMISRNSSVTTSSNGSSEQATSGAADTEGSEQNQDDMISEYRTGPFHDNQDEVFALDKMDGTGGAIGHEPQKGLPHVQAGELKVCELDPNRGDPQENGHHDAATATTTTEELYVQGVPMDTDSPEKTLICSRCGCKYRATKPVESEDTICPECKLKELSNVITLVEQIDVHNSSYPFVGTSEHGALQVAEPLNSVFGLPELVRMDTPEGGLWTVSLEGDVGENETSYGEPGGNHLYNYPAVLVGEETTQNHDQQAVRQSLSPSGPSSSACQSQDLIKFGEDLFSKVDVAEVAGISVLLLKRSNSSKGPIMPSRNITVSAISYEDSFCARDSTTSLRSSTGHGSASTSSSTDLTLVRHAETRMQRQLSSTRSDMSSKPQSNGSSLSGSSSHAYQGLSIRTNTEENVEVSVDKTPEPSEEPILRETSLDEGSCPVNMIMSAEAKDPDILDLSSNTLSIQSEDNGLALMPVREDHDLHGIHEQVPSTVTTREDMEESVASFMEGNAVPDNADEIEDTEMCDHKSLAVTSEIGIDDCPPSSPTLQIEVTSKDDLQEPTDMPNQEEVADSFSLSIDQDHVHGVIEESTVKVEDEGGRTTRSMTLEEATDAILFCSSIVHNLAYEAANIAIEKEKENLVPLEVSRPMVTLLGKNNMKDSRGTSPGKRTPRSQKTKPRRAGTDAEPLSNKDEIDDNKPTESKTRIVGIPERVDGMKAPKLESKCNCTIM